MPNARQHAHPKETDLIRPAVRLGLTNHFALVLHANPVGTLPVEAALGREASAGRLIVPRRGFKPRTTTARGHAIHEATDRVLPSTSILARIHALPVSTNEIGRTLIMGCTGSARCDLPPYTTFTPIRVSGLSLCASTLDVIPLELAKGRGVTGVVGSAVLFHWITPALWVHSCKAWSAGAAVAMSLRNTNRVRPATLGRADVVTLVEETITRLVEKAVGVVDAGDGRAAGERIRRVPYVLSRKTLTLGGMIVCHKKTLVMLSRITNVKKNST